MTTGLCTNMLVTVILTGLFAAVMGWHLVMKVPQGNLGDGNVTSVYDLWASNKTLNPDAENVMNILPGIPYKSADILNWETKNISLVKLAFYHGVEEVAYIVFSSAGPWYNHSDWPIFSESTNQMNWFNCSRIMLSTFSDRNAEDIPAFCTIHSTATLDHSFSILNRPVESQSDCTNVSGWFTVLEPASLNSAISCPWKIEGNPPHFLFAKGNTSVKMSDAAIADVLAVFVDDCIDPAVCHSPECWQDPHGNCNCNGYKCTEACSHLPCPEGTKCVSNLKNESQYTCECLYGHIGDECLASEAKARFTPAAIAGIVFAGLLVIGLFVVVVFGFCRWKIRKDKLKQEMTQKAVLAKDFVRRSVNRLSGRQHQFQRKHLKEEKPSPPVTTKSGKSEQLSPDSSIVFGEINPAFSSDEPATPQPTPPVERRYTEFPTRQNAQIPASVSVTEIQLHEKAQSDNKPEPQIGVKKRYENLPVPPTELRLRRESPQNLEMYDRASTVGSYERASTMSEISDATSTSGYSDHTVDAPANLPPSEMISKDIMPRYGHHRHKARSRPRSRASTVDPPKPIVAPEIAERQINYAMERSRLSISSLSSLSSEATHKSDSTQRSGELTKSDVLRARYEHVMNSHNDPAGRLSRYDHMIKHGDFPTYVDIKRQLDADMSRREARERKLQLEQEREVKYEAEKAKKHRMRQVESLDSGIDAENTSGDRNSDGKIKIVRARSADQLDRKLVVSFSSKEATV